MRGLPGDRLASDTRTGDEQGQKRDCTVTAAHKLGEPVIRIEAAKPDTNFLLNEMENCQHRPLDTPKSVHVEFER
jgi:hypothetical protein